MTETPKTVWVTKYALSDGIEECTSIGAPRPDEMIRARFPNGRFGYVPGKDWHTTREAAVARAEQMRAAKLASLDKQAERLRGKVF